MIPPKNKPPVQRESCKVGPEPLRNHERRPRPNAPRGLVQLQLQCHSQFHPSPSSSSSSRPQLQVTHSVDLVRPALESRGREECWMYRYEDQSHVLCTRTAIRPGSCPSVCLPDTGVALNWWSLSCVEPGARSAVAVAVAVAAAGSCCIACLAPPSVGMGASESIVFGR
jgi:hypothetical protein